MEGAVKTQKAGGVHVLKGVALQAMQNVMPLQIQTVIYQHLPLEGRQHQHQLVVSQVTIVQQVLFVMLLRYVIRAFVVLLHKSVVNQIMYQRL